MTTNTDTIFALCSIACDMECTYPRYTLQSDNAWFIEFTADGYCVYHQPVGGGKTTDYGKYDSLAPAISELRIRGDD